MILKQKHLNVALSTGIKRHNRDLFLIAGNFNGRESDDILGRDGQRYLNVDQLGGSWRLRGNNQDQACITGRTLTTTERHIPRGRRQRASTTHDRYTSHGTRAYQHRGTVRVTTACLQGASLDSIQRQCDILKSVKFHRCHSRVDVTHYYQ